VNRTKKACFLVLGLFSSVCFAQQLLPVQIIDKVGDTIDLQERNQYNLFTGINNFESAIFSKSDTFYLVQVNYLQNDSLMTDTLKLTSFEINRINYCINNADSIRTLINRDQATHAAFERFWQNIESKRINKLKPITETKSKEGRVVGSLTGMTIGSAVGGCVGSQVGIAYVGTRYEPCFEGSIAIPMYEVNQPVFCCINALAIGAGTYIGYKLGEQTDRKYSPTMIALKEGKAGRIGLGIFSGIIGVAVGTSVFVATGVTAFGKINDVSSEVQGGEVVIIPALLLGTGIAYQITYWGYRLGKLIDHNDAVKAANKNKVK
jgi:hypothetical protein